jgi:hypothetical protein
MTAQDTASGNGNLASDSDFAWAHPEIARQNRSDTVQSPGNDDAALRSVMSASWRRADESKERHYFRF